MIGAKSEEDTKIKIKSLWNALADEFEIKIGDEGDIVRRHQANPMLFSLLQKCDGENVLDIGCGNGYLFPMLYGKGFLADGLDISPKQLSYASKRVRGGALFAADIENIDSLPSKKYDILICSFVLDGLQNLDLAIRGCYGLLREQGHLIINIPHPCFIGYEFWNKGQHTDYVKEDKKGEEVYLQKCTKPVLFFQRPLSSYMNALSKTGFYIKEICEPDPTNVDQYFIDSNRKPKPTYCLGILAMRSGNGRN